MELNIAIKKLQFKWLPKHLNHIAENIVFKKRNISFLAINALFRSKSAKATVAEPPFINSYILKGYVEVLPNDLLRIKAENLAVVFRLDEFNNIIVVTAYSESDD
jgi:hypothetical protein